MDESLRRKLIGKLERRFPDIVSFEFRHQGDPFVCSDGKTRRFSIEVVRVGDGSTGTFYERGDPFSRELERMIPEEVFFIKTIWMDVNRRTVQTRVQVQFQYDDKLVWSTEV